MRDGARQRLVWSLARSAAAAIVLLLPAILFHGPWRTAPWPAGLRHALLLLAGAMGGMLLPLRSASLPIRALLGVQASAAAVVLASPIDLASSYPFSLSWSEGDRIWASSLVFRAVRYPGLTPELHPVNPSPAFYFLQGLPFLVPGVTIGALRVWNASLLELPALVLAGVVFLGRSRWPSGALRWCLILWAFLFVMQGPVYSTLAVGAVTVVLACRSHRRAWAVAAILAAGFFVGLCRWTWMVAPAVWSSTWALLDPTMEEPRRWQEAFGCAVSGAIGAGLSLVWTGWFTHRPALPYLTSLQQVILKYRLLPNATSPLGIGPWIALVSAPAVILILWRWRRSELWRRWRISFVVGAGALLLFSVGLVASLKIGGGDNLHHFDMFLIDAVLILGALSIWGDDGVILHQGSKRPTIVAAVALLAPVFSVLSLRPTPVPPAEEIARASLERIREAVAEAAARGPVLFIDQRQLLTFGLVPEAEEVWDYDLLDLMDRAMANDGGYLHRFQADLAAARFSLIVVDPLPIIYWDRASPFGEENDAWVRNVSVPILEHYRPIAELDDVGVWLLEPLSEGSESASPASDSSPSGN